MFACLHARSSAGQLAALAAEFSPLVEKTAPDTVIFSIVGLERLIGAPQQIAAEVARRGSEMGIQANLAIAHNPDTARLAARHLPGITLIPPGKEADRLGGIPVTALDATRPRRASGRRGRLAAEAGPGADTPSTENCLAATGF